jgi:dihydrofolate reductase
MARFLYSATMSLDGFIAGPGGDMSWLTEHLGPNPYVDRLVGEIGALLVGHRTFGGDDPHRGTEQEGKPFGGGWSGPQIVLTHEARESSDPDLVFVADLPTAIARSAEAAGDAYVNVLGADTARQVLEAGALDEVLVCIAPVLLGDGVRLFEHPGGRHVRLERTHLSGEPHAAMLRYRVPR